MLTISSSLGYAHRRRYNFTLCVSQKVNESRTESVPFQLILRNDSTAARPYRHLYSTVIREFVFFFFFSCVHKDCWAIDTPIVKDS